MSETTTKQNIPEQQTIAPTNLTPSDSGVLTTRFALNFIKISLAYFLIGAIWMGLAHFIPEPWSGTTYASSAAVALYDVARVHVMVIGWASFALMGAIYYFVPRAAGKPLHSIKLAKVHFWVTNVAVPLAILDETYATFIIGSLMQSGQSSDEAMGSGMITPLLLIYLIVYLAGLATQFIFVYNIYRTIRE